MVKDSWPVIAEDFSQWVVEDNFCNGKPAWDKVGSRHVTTRTESIRELGSSRCCNLQMVVPPQQGAPYFLVLLPVVLCIGKAVECLSVLIGGLVLHRCPIDATTAQALLSLRRADGSSERRAGGFVRWHSLAGGAAVSALLLHRTLSASELSAG